MLLIRDWDVEVFDVDGGGDMGVDTGAIEVEVFNCAIGGGVVLVPEPTTTYKL